MGLAYASCCETGLKRTVNQDRTVVLEGDGRGLFLVADGMGGHSEGERASGTLRAGFTDWWSRASQQLDFETAVAELKTVLQKCNSEIRFMTPPGVVCGSTLTLLWLQNGKYALFHVGDSRCYQVTASLLGQPKVSQLTTDDVSRDGTHTGMLLRAVGVSEECRFSLQSGPLPKRAVFALCSDGVYKYCEEVFLSRSLIRCFRGRDLAEERDRIAQHVLSRGAGDNYSLILIRLRTGCAADRRLPR